MTSVHSNSFIISYTQSCCVSCNHFHVPRFIELASILEPGRPPKTDKSAILVDAVRMVTRLRGESQKLKDSNLSLQDKIKELKVTNKPPKRMKASCFYIFLHKEYPLLLL